MDQLYVQRFGQDTPIPSMQLSIEPVDQSGGCAYGYACVYTDTISWAAPDQPLPMVRDPRMVFEQLFGAGGTPEQRAERRATDRSILDMLTEQMADAARGRSARPIGSGSISTRTNIREIEQRIPRIEARNTSGEARELPGAPAGVPDSFDEHVKLMFDLQVLAFTSDTTRVFSFKFGRDGSGRVYPGSGVDTRLPQRVAPRRGRGAHQAVRARSTSTTCRCCRTSWRSCRRTMDGDANLLDKTLILYGSPMANGNNHNHRNCPLILLGRGGGALEGGVHIKAAERHADGQRHADADAQARLDDIQTFGDSTGEFSFDARRDPTT